ncbi:MAG: MSHA biogenesis protein MshK [Pseudomonadota bacterium]
MTRPKTKFPQRASTKTPARLRRLLLLVACSLPPASAAYGAEVLRDPTRPPAALHAGGEPVMIPAGPVLQSIRRANGRYTAVINGETVKVGSTIGDARVVKISDTEVVLKTADSLQTLKLFPDVEKRPAATNRRPSR